MAILGVAAAGSVDPEIHRQTDRRDPWAGVGDRGHRPDHYCDRCHHRRAPDCAGRHVDGQIHLWLIK